MKQVKITNAAVKPLWKPRGSSDPDQYVRVIPPKEGSEFKSHIVNFEIETRVSDNPARRARLFEKCTVYAKSEANVQELRELIKAGAILEIEGYEDRRPSGKDDGKYYANIVCNRVTPITESPSDAANDPQAASVGDDDLPF